MSPAATMAAVDRVCQIEFRFGRILAARPAFSNSPKPTIEIFNYGQIELDKDNARGIVMNSFFSISAYFYVIGSNLQNSTFESSLF